MEATVENVLKLEQFRGSRIVAGINGRNNRVRCIDVMEVPDVKPWLREGEILLTTAYSLQNDVDSLCELIQFMSQTNCAALAIKFGRFLGTVPDKIIAYGNRFGLPVIDVAADTPYVDIITAIMDLVLNYQQNLLRRSVEVHKQLTKSVLENQGIAAIADSIATIGGCQIIIQNACGQVIARAGHNNSRTKIKKALPILYNHMQIGLISLIKDADKAIEFDTMILEHAATVAALEMFKERALTEANFRSRSDFIYDLISGNISERQAVFNRSRFLGIEPEQVMILLVINIDDFKKYTAVHPEDEVNKIKEALFNLVLNAVEQSAALTFLGDKLVVLCPVITEDEAQDMETASNLLAQKIHQLILKELSQITVTIGVGAICRSLFDVKTSYDQAMNALRIGGALYGKGRIIHANDLGAFQLLPIMKDHPNVKAVISHWIGEIIEYDTRRHTNLLATLEVYLETDSNVQETAKQLFIHRNTLRYRLNKLKELTKDSMDKQENKLHLLMCIKLWKLTK